MTTQDSTLKATVKEKYGQAALRVSEAHVVSCSRQALPSP